MKHVLHFCVALFALTCSINAQDANTGSVGTDFRIAIPPNEIEEYPAKTLAIFISSAFDTEISLIGPGMAEPIRRQIKAGTTLTLDDKNSPVSWSWEIRGMEIVENKGIHITSEKPVTVSVLSSKQFTSDGFTAIPTVSWDNEYIAASYYDFNEIRRWAGGFMVLAGEDDTRVTIMLRGTGSDTMRTAGGRHINTGESYTVTLNAGDVYAVKGDASTRGEFDLTGSLIRSTKAIGVIGFHERTTMPNSVRYVDGYWYDGRNHLSEMLPPLSDWDTIYVTQSLLRIPFEDRDSSSTLYGSGDFYRVVASEANTNVVCRYYDPVTKRQRGTYTRTIDRAGGFIDVEQVADPRDLPSGQVVWTSDKPILVLLHSCSWRWDLSRYLDPFSIVLISPSKHAPLAMFQTAPILDFTRHFVNIVVGPLGTDSIAVEDLKSITLDGVPLHKHTGVQAPGLLDGKVPGTRYYTVAVNLDSIGRSYRLASNGKVALGGHIYGHGESDAYGWPIGGRPYSLIGIDTMPPVLVKTPGCASWDFTATELRDHPSPRAPRPKATDQVESGIASVMWDDNGGTNLALLNVGSGQFSRDSALKERSFTVRVVDPAQTAAGIVVVRDFAGNQVRDTLVWKGLPLTQRSTPFGITRPGSVRTSTITIRNGSPQPLAFTSTSLRKGSPFSLRAPMLPITIAANDSIVCTIAFAPKTEDGPGISIDTMTVTVGCYRIPHVLMATAGEPEIAVDEVRLVRTSDAPNEVCMAHGGRIVNTGTDTLVVHSIDGVSGGFSYKPGDQFTLPVRILPGAHVLIGEICYQGTDTDMHSIDITVRSNAVRGDSLAVWSVVRDSVLSVHDDREPATRLMLHPTPSMDRVTVTTQTAFPTAEPIEIIDGKGMRVGTFALPAGTTTIELDLSAFASGSYTVRVGSTSAVLSGRLVIAR